MATGREQHAASVNLPLQNSTGVKNIAVLAVTTASQSVDLSTLFGDIDSAAFLTLMADMPANTSSTVYVALGANSAGSISETATGIGATVCWPIPHNQQLPGVVLSGEVRSSGIATSIQSLNLYYKGSNTGYLRIQRSSSDPGIGVKAFPPP